MRNKSRKYPGLILAVWLLICSLAGLPAGEVRAAENAGYVPMDIILVIDISGSMKTSDPERQVVEAFKLFAEKMPATDESRLAIIGFNHNATAFTQENGNPAFYKMSDLKNIENIRGTMSGLEYGGGTGVGYGMKMATDLMQKEKRDDAECAILLFSDGVDDISSAVKMQESQEYLSEAVLWAKNHGCPVYPIGFNYQLGDGKDSIGGEGLEKLQYISDTTDAFFTEVHTLADIKNAINSILATMLKESQSDPVKVQVPGIHRIRVPEGVVEMNIVIDAENNLLDQVAISLEDPDGQDVPLTDGENIRYYKGSNNANIKIIHPAGGTWTLILDGEAGEVDVSFLNHYQLGMSARLTVPSGNPENTAYQGDPVVIEALIQSDAGDNLDSYLYDEVRMAQAQVRPRGAGAPVTLPMQYDAAQGCLSATYTADGNSVCDIEVTVDTPYFTRTERLVLENGNRPLALTGTEIPNQRVNVGKSVVIDDIYSYVQDPEGDEITAAIGQMSDATKVRAQVQGDTITIEGLKRGSSVVTVEYTDAQGNSAERSFTVHVRDWKLTVLIAMPFVIGAVVAVVAAVLAREGTRRVSGAFDVSVSVTEGGKQTHIGSPTRMKAGVACRGMRTSMKHFMRKYTDQTSLRPNVSEGQKEVLRRVFKSGTARNGIANALDGVVIKGTPLGKSGMILQVKKGLPVKIDRNEEGIGISQPVRGRRKIDVTVHDQAGTEAKIRIEYDQNGR